MTTITALPSGSAPTGAEVGAFDQGSSTVKLTIPQIVSRAGGSVRAVTGTSDTLLAADRAGLVTYSNASAIAVSVPIASTLASPYFTYLYNKGAGTATFTPTTSTINGASSLALTTGQGAILFSDGTNYQAVTTASGGGGGLTNWTEAVSTTSPNGTVPVVSFVPNNAASGVDVAIVPKGTASFQLSIPNGSTSGGAKRGTSSVDLSLQRSSSTQIASGTNSFVVGVNVTASGTSTWVVGDTSTATGSYSGALGFNNNATGFASVALGGRQNTSDGQQSVTIGGQYLHTRGITGLTAFGCSGQTQASQNKRQGELLAWAKQTTDATPTKMSSDGGTPGTTNQIVLNNNSAVTITGQVTARNSSNGDTKGWNFYATVKRGASAGTTTLVGTPTVNVAGGDSGASAWAFAIIADTTNGALSLQVTGAASTNIDWQASTIGAFCSS